jgi:hypothetical protein
LLLALSCMASCTNYRPPLLGGTVDTVDLELLAPMSGSPGAPSTDRNSVFNLMLYDTTGELFPGQAIVDVYLSYGGVRSGIPADCGQVSDAPIETLTFSGGQLLNHALTLPEAYGATSIWAVERTSNAIGASSTIYYPNPTIPQIQTPPDPTAANATYCSSFNGKFIDVNASTGPTSQLLIESVFGNSITAIDTGATTYHSMYVFLYSQPTVDMVPGRHILSFNGNISKFVGFTELNFPVVNVDDTILPEPQLLPAPVVLSQTDITNLPKLAGLTSGVVTISGKVCPVNPPNPNNDPTIQNTIDQWTKYSTFILGTVDCDSFSEYAVVLPSKVVGTFDPTQSIGKPATITGMLKNSSGQNSVDDANGNPITCSTQTPCASGTCTNGYCLKAAYNFWSVVIRGPSDVPQ